MTNKLQALATNLHFNNLRSIQSEQNLSVDALIGL